jgi:hypothetical protein
MRNLKKITVPGSHPKKWEFGLSEYFRLPQESLIGLSQLLPKGGSKSLVVLSTGTGKSLYGDFKVIVLYKNNMKSDPQTSVKQ